MLYASKRELHAELARDILQVRQRELQYYTTNINNIGLQASLLAGFAFTTLASHESRDVLGWLDEIAGEDRPFIIITDFRDRLDPFMQLQVLLELFYLTSTISAMGSTLYTLYICLITSILGPGLALRGPEGSVDRAVLGLARVNRKVIQSFAFALNLFQFSILINSFLNFHVIAAFVCMVFVVYYMVTITKYGNNLTKEFLIDSSHIVTGRFEEDQADRGRGPNGLIPAEVDLFPTVGDNLKDNTVRKEKQRASQYNDDLHKPSNVASSMMYFWQGPVDKGQDEAPAVRQQSSWMSRFVSSDSRGGNSSAPPGWSSSSSADNLSDRHAYPGGDTSRNGPALQHKGSRGAGAAAGQYPLPKVPMYAKRAEAARDTTRPVERGPEPSAPLASLAAKDLRGI